MIAHAPLAPPFPFGTALHDPETGWSCFVAAPPARVRLEAGNVQACLLLGHADDGPRMEAWPAATVERRFRSGSAPNSRRRPARAMPSPVFAVHQCLVHHKGGHYRVLFAPDRLTLSDGTPAYAYIQWGEESVAPIWVRAASEMEDGRFTTAP